MDELETLYPASTYFQYSNFGMSILGAVVEELSGMDFEKYVQENILNPLELKDTRPFMPQDLLDKQLATGYSALDRSGDREKLDLFFTDGITAAAGFTSTVEDLAKFASWQFRLLEEGEKVIFERDAEGNVIKSRQHLSPPVKQHPSIIRLSQTAE